MRRPPGRIAPILQGSPNEWIKRLAGRHQPFAALAVTPDERGQLDSWLVSRFVSATLQLERGNVEQLTNALREVITPANAEGRAARLTPQMLAKLGGAFRTSDDSADRPTAQVPAAYLARAVENACDWFTAESFAELNPVEQAAIVFLRLAAVRPFEQANQATALVAASLFTLRAGLPPVVIKPELQAAFRQAMAEADRMNMQPIVELFADAVGQTLDEMTGFVKQMRGGRE